jgi:hypothetical protein
MLPIPCMSHAESIARRLISLGVGLVTISLGGAAVQGAPGSVGGVVFLVAAALVLAGALAAIPTVRFATYALISVLLLPAMGVSYLLASRLSMGHGLVLLGVGVLALLLAVWPPRGRRSSLPPSSRPSSV